MEQVLQYSAHDDADTDSEVPYSKTRSFVLLFLKRHSLSSFVKQLKDFVAQCTADLSKMLSKVRGEGKVLTV